eukprot:Skav212622  [mRNA]  locus=scaffold173:108137:112236:+ [translate_table: standard]
MDAHQCTGPVKSISRVVHWSGLAKGAAVEDTVAAMAPASDPTPRPMALGAQPAMATQPALQPASGSATLPAMMPMRTMQPAQTMPMQLPTVPGQVRHGLLNIYQIASKAIDQHGLMEKLQMLLNPFWRSKGAWQDLPMLARSSDHNGFDVSLGYWPQ